MQSRTHGKNTASNFMFHCELLMVMMCCFQQLDFYVLVVVFCYWFRCPWMYVYDLSDQLHLNVGQVHLNVDEFGS